MHWEQVIELILLFKNHNQIFIKNKISVLYLIYI